MQFFDTHAHYNDEKFNEDAESLLANMKQDQLGGIVIPGYNIQACHRAIELANKFENVFCAVRNTPKRY